MDYARKIGKTKEKKIVRQPIAKLTISDDLISKSEEFDDDRRLVNWKKWLGDRKKQYEYLKFTTGREPANQVLNSCDNVREQIEMRNLMDCAIMSEPMVPDKFRGGPEFWLTPESLPNKGDSCLPDISLIPTKRQLNVKPELMYMGLPRAIEKEKDLLNIKSKRSTWKSSSYLEKKKNTLASEIKKIIEKEPEIDKLVIEGHSYQPPEKPIHVPVITITSPEQSLTRRPWGVDHTSVALKIQDKEIVWEENLVDEKNSEPITWSLNFKGMVGEIVEKELVLENRGNRVIVYSWQEVEIEFLGLTFRPYVSSFFFQKSRSVILPGQFNRIKIWYKPHKPCVSRETWKLITVPRIISSPLIFSLWGCADVDTATIRSKLLNIDKYLDSQIRNKVIHDIMEDILEKIGVSLPAEPPYYTLFLESDIFKAKNPIYFYHPSTITKLHNLYSNIENGNISKWNLSLVDLRDRLLQIKESEYKEEMFEEFNELCSECLRPSLYHFQKNNKYQVVYNTLCSFFNIFHDEAEFIISSCFLNEDKNGTSDTSSGSKKINAQSKYQYQLYRQILFIHIYHLLKDVIGKISVIIDSFNKLNCEHK